ncbi:MAG: TlpA family protein disulfide reductase [Acidimicrobiia bacterium]
MTALVWLLTAVVALLALLVVGLLRSHATILRALHEAGIDLDPDADPHRRSHGVSVGVDEPRIRTQAGVPGPAGASGQRATDLVGQTPAGGTRTVSVTSGQPTLLAFLSTGCSTCATFWQAFSEAGAAGGDPLPRLGLPAGLRLVIVAKGPELESPGEVAALAPEGVLTIQSSQAWDDYRIPVAPYFTLVDGRRGVVVGEGAAASWERVRDLIQRSLADAALEETLPSEEGRLRRRDVLTGRVRGQRIDQDLLDAGIEPGDPRLFHGPGPSES